MTTATVTLTADEIQILLSALNTHTSSLCAAWYAAQARGGLAAAAAISKGLRQVDDLAHKLSAADTTIDSRTPGYHSDEAAERRMGC